MTTKYGWERKCVNTITIRCVIVLHLVFLVLETSMDGLIALFQRLSEGIQKHNDYEVRIDE